MARRERYHRLKNAGLCVKCGKVPPVEGQIHCQPCKDYFKSYRSGSGSYAAKHAKWNREWGQKNKEKKSATDKKLRDRWKVEAISAYGGLCVCCGEVNLKFLSIDHINNNGKEHRKDTGGSYFYCKLKKLGYPQDGLQVLCFNCNLGRAINGGVCPHHDTEVLTCESIGRGAGVTEAQTRGADEPAD